MTKVIARCNPGVRRGKGVTQYNRVESFGVPAVRERQIVEKIDGQIRGHDWWEAHARDKMRQDFDKGLDWDLVRFLMDNEKMSLEDAKSEARVISYDSDPYGG